MADTANSVDALFLNPLMHYFIICWCIISLFLKSLFLQLMHYFIISKVNVEKDSSKICLVINLIVPSQKVLRFISLLLTWVIFNSNRKKCFN